MKQIKLTGREMAVLRAIENLGTEGHEIADRTKISIPDLTDILGALCDAGYVDGYPAGAAIASMDALPEEQVAAARFEVNPSYAGELKKALLRH